MQASKSVPAFYQPTGIRAFDGNPFIEALPKRFTKKSEYETLVCNYPDVATEEVRGMDEIARIILLEEIADVVIPFPEYKNVAIDMSMMVMKTYLGRNPLDAVDIQRRHAIANGGADGVPFPASWRSHARGFLLVAVSGMGKTTLISGFWLRYHQVIQHTEYHGRPLKCLQVVYVILRIPIDGSLLSMFLQFFEEIDRLCGTTYLREAKTERTIPKMLILMWRVSNAVSLGVIIFDEVINLRCARGPNVEYVLNMFSEIVEKFGVSVVVLATPAFQKIIEASFRNLRKTQSAGSVVVEPMRLKKDSMFHVVADFMWNNHYYLKNKAPLTKEIRSAWYDCCGGDTALMSLSYMNAQRNEIGAGECLDEVAFKRVENKEFALLRPAIAALKKGDPDSLAAFEDLLSPGAKKMIDNNLKVTRPKPEPPGRPDLDEIDKAEAKREKDASSSKNRGRKNAGGKEGRASGAPTLPVEDPLGPRNPKR